MIQFRKVALIIYFSVYCSLGLMAQLAEDSVRDAHPISFNKVNLKVDATNMINPQDPSFMMSVEYQFKPWVSITQEVGKVLTTRGPESPDEDVVGYKFREELRFYFSPHRENSLTYVSINSLFRYMNVGQQITVGYGCTDSWKGSCDYLQQARSNLKSYRYGGSLRMGMIKPVTDRIFIEADLGWTVYYHQLSRDNQKAGATYFFNDSFLNREQAGWRLTPSFNARIGFVLVKRTKD